jgi:hypothetical protein
MRKLLAGGLVLLATAVAAPAAFGSNYVVLYKQAVDSNAAATIKNAGGSLVYSHPQIGVVIASSSNPSFRDNLLKDSKVESASSTDGTAGDLEG